MKITPRFKVRSKQSRRVSINLARFPLQVNKSEVVLRERRVNPDRRHPGIQTQELVVTPEEFEELFEAYEQQS